MEKEIPNSQEKSTKAARLREAARRLREDFSDRPPTDAEWDALTADLTQDDLAHLAKLARGHLDRAVAAAKAGETEDALDEGAAAVRLQPRDPGWAREVAASLRYAGLSGPGAEAFLAPLERKKKPRKGSRWLIGLVVALVALPLGVASAFYFWPKMNFGAPVNRVQGPRALESVFDTQGVRTNIEVAQSRLLIFPEATVAELSAWVTFPDHRVDLWEGTVSLLDGQGQALAKRDVTFRASSEGPLAPGQGVAVFQQFDAWPWFDRVASFQVTTSRILAQPTQPAARDQMPLAGTDTLTAGYGLRAWVQESRWADRFASRVHTLSLEFENTGLKPFSELEVALVWKDGLGKVLKTLTFRPVSAFRTALPSGGRLAWTQETVFDTEVFSWAAGDEPHPVLELRRWR